MTMEAAAASIRDKREGGLQKRYDVRPEENWMPTNTEIVQACLEAFGRGDIATILDACTDNAEVIVPGERSIIPYAGEWKGKSRVEEYFRVIGETVDVLKWMPQHVLGSEDRVAAFGAMDLRVKATGKTLINTPWALIFPMENGKVGGWQICIDTAATEKAFTATAKASG
jgi:ketosteroid isomerase-like protein